MTYRCKKDAKYVDTYAWITYINGIGDGKQTKYGNPSQSKKGGFKGS